MGVGGCGCPSSLSVTRKGMDSWPLMKSAPSSASAAEARTFRMMRLVVWSGPFGLGLVGRGDGWVFGFVAEVKVAAGAAAGFWG